MFSWTAIYLVDVETIDEEHRQLFNLIGDLQTAMNLDQADSIIVDIYIRLIDYTRFHFATEQALMEKHQYPDKEAHIREHVELTRKVVEMDQRRALGKSRITIDTLTFLFDWLSHHILVTDKKLAAHLHSKNVF
jgi:hemerythrin